MAIEDVRSYIQEHHQQFPVDVLLAGLRRAGYPEEEIQSALAMESAAIATVPSKAAFAAPPAKSSLRKIGEWLLGFIGGSFVIGGLNVGLVGVLFSAGVVSFKSTGTLVLLISASMVILVVIGLVVFHRIRKRSRYIARGLLTFIIFEVGVLVVLIIGAGIVSQSLNSAQSKSRDARRLADMSQMRVALELHYDRHQSYPASLKELSPAFIQVLPSDPTTGALYIYEQRGQGYYLAVSLEDPSHYKLSNDAYPGNGLYEIEENITSSPAH